MTNRYLDYEKKKEKEEKEISPVYIVCHCWFEENLSLSSKFRDNILKNFCGFFFKELQIELEETTRI